MEKLKQTLVGVGGWAYFPLKLGNKLEICSKLYDFVELNSTFYKLPPISQVKKWRARVPDGFEFTVRVSRDLTHVGLLRPSNRNLKIFENHLEICKELDARILHFQFPPSLEVTGELVKEWKEFIVSANKLAKSRDLHFAFEVRNSNSSSSSSLNSFYRENDIIPCSDATNTSLSVSSDSKILYTRVFGPGEHTKWSFDTNELLTLSKKVESIPARKRYVTFHNITMYEDASRIKNILETGKDTITKGPVGLESFQRILSLARMKYPISKKTLLEEFRWRTFSSDQEIKKHMGEILEVLPERQYLTFEEIIQQASLIVQA
ncbi:MAG TPA: DUF72 domain-containing protein [Nitrososphaerales archaeon]|nr:DUF72 domain-containing protein [Nitrososphaerales archaeon]